MMCVPAAAKRAHTRMKCGKRLLLATRRSFAEEPLDATNQPPRPFYEYCEYDSTFIAIYHSV